MAQTKWVDGYLVTHDDASEASWLDALGTNARKWELRYGADFTTGREFTTTAVSAGTGTSTIVQSILAGVRGLITTTADGENDGINLQVVGTPFQLAADKPCYFGASVKLDHATRPDFFVGLASLDTTIMAAHDMAVGASAVGFYNLSTGAGQMQCYNEIHADIVTTATSRVLSTNDSIYEFVHDGAGNIDFYLDRVWQARHSTHVPTVVLSPSIVLQNGTGNGLTARINWMRCIQLG